mmetsp:Transcript_98512/g.317639  ORF Transcript_98512/g.317639 Transcript_98512/m.317639 type:complete len:207 (+) Transcript_98512:371-991(+)
MRSSFRAWLPRRARSKLPSTLCSPSLLLWPSQASSSAWTAPWLVPPPRYRTLARRTMRSSRRSWTRMAGRWWADNGWSGMRRSLRRLGARGATVRGRPPMFQPRCRGRGSRPLRPPPCLSHGRSSRSQVWLGGSQARPGTMSARRPRMQGKRRITTSGTGRASGVLSGTVEVLAVRMAGLRRLQPAVADAAAIWASARKAKCHAVA